MEDIVCKRPCFTMVNNGVIDCGRVDCDVPLESQSDKILIFLLTVDIWAKVVRRL